MARIRVVTDSACDIPEEVARRLNIDIVSLSIRFGDEDSPIASISHRKRFGEVQGQQDTSGDSGAVARRFSGRVRTGEGRQLRRRHRAHVVALLSATNQSAVLAPRPWRCLGRSRHRHQGRLDGAGFS